jgi:cellulose biosynthesis protein BcsQ
MKLLPAANMKGGVGKTTVIVSLADGLAYVYGFKVLVIDLDMQCNASQVVWGDTQPLPWRGEENIEGFLRRWHANPRYDPLLDIKSNVICHQRQGQSLGWISLFSSSNKLRILERKWLSEMGSYEACVTAVEKAIDSILSRVAGGYDIILVDCPPGISMLTEAVLKKADMLLVPTAPTRFGIEAQNNYIDFVAFYLAAVDQLPATGILKLAKKLDPHLPGRDAMPEAWLRAHVKKLIIAETEPAKAIKKPRQPKGANGSAAKTRRTKPEKVRVVVNG